MAAHLEDALRELLADEDFLTKVKSSFMRAATAGLASAPDNTAALRKEQLQLEKARANLMQVIETAEEVDGSMAGRYTELGRRLAEVQKALSTASVGTPSIATPSLFNPSRLYISPPIDALGGTGMFGATWSPLGLTLVTTGQKSNDTWNKSRGRLVIDSSLLLTYLFVFNPLGLVPTTHFLRPGLELKLEIVISVTEKFLISLGGGAQLYAPQRVGTFIEFGPISEAIWVTAFAFLKFHARFPYEVNL